MREMRFTAKYSYLAFAVCAAFMVLYIGSRRRDTALVYDPTVNKDDSSSNLQQQDTQYAEDDASRNSEGSLQSGSHADPSEASISEPHKVILFAYMRGGSSWTGELFDQNKNATYWYEPVDAFYTQYMGLPTWTYPAEELYFEGPERRNIPAEERQALTTFLRSILDCDIDSFSPELLSHSNADPTKMRWLKPFGSCNPTYKAAQSCISHIKPKCSNLRQVEQSTCVQSLQDARNDRTTAEPFTKYVSCMRSVKGNVNKCLPAFKQACANTNVRSIKVLRMHMSDMEELVKQDPNVQVIHLIRDPRGIVRSRLKSKHTRHSRLGKIEPLAAGEKEDENEAKYLCAKMFSDLTDMRQLKDKYPGRFLEVKYEEMSAEPTETATKIYDYLSLRFPENVKQWLYEVTHANKDGEAFGYNRKDPKKTAEAWKEMGERYSERVVKHCREFMQLADYPV